MCVCVCVGVVVVVVVATAAAVVVFSLVIRRALAADAGKDLHFLVYGKNEDRHAIKCIPIHILLMSSLGNLLRDPGVTDGIA